MQEITISERGCGFRKEGGLYLVGGFNPNHSSWFPHSLKCLCGIQHLRTSRNIQVFKPGVHFPELALDPGASVQESEKGFRFFKNEDHYAITVGVEHYPDPKDYLSEAAKQGFSRLIREVPRKFELGKTWVFIIHPRAFKITEEPSLFEPNKRPKVTYEPGVIAAYMPEQIQYVVTGKETDQYLKSLEDKGITPTKVSYV